jgi:serine/threonine-protein kinase
VALLDEKDTGVFVPDTGSALTGTYYGEPEQSSSDDSVRLHFVRAGLSDVFGSEKISDAISRVSGSNGKPPNLDAVIGTMFGSNRDLRRRLVDQLSRIPTPRLDFEGKYVLLDALERGGQGIVQFAVDCREGNPSDVVVIKSTNSPLTKLQPWEMGRFEREWEILQTMNGDHTAKLLDHGITGTSGPGDQYPYFVQELIRGYPLNKMMQSHGKPFPEGIAVQLIQKAARSLAAVHGKTRGPHRDVKPANLILADDYDVKIIDFGLAALEKLQQEDPTTREQISRLTRTGVVFGTPQYMSPEQCVDSGDVDARGDQYPLGIILYELLTHENPFQGKTVAAMWAKHRSFHPDLLCIKNRKLAGVIATMLQKDRAKRFASMEEVDGALAATQDRKTSVALSMKPSEVSSDEAPIFSAYPTPGSMMESILDDESRNDIGFQKPGIARVFFNRAVTRRNALLALGVGALGTVVGLPWILNRNKQGGSPEVTESLEQQLRKEGKYLFELDIDDQKGIRRIVFPNGLSFEGHQIVQLYSNMSAGSASEISAGGYLELSSDERFPFFGIVKPGQKPSEDDIAKIPPELGMLRVQILSMILPGKGRVTRVRVSNAGAFFLEQEPVEYQGRSMRVAKFYTVADNALLSTGKLVQSAFPTDMNHDQGLMRPDEGEFLEAYTKLNLTSRSSDDSRHEKLRFQPQDVPGVVMQQMETLLKRREGFKKKGLIKA